MKMQPSKLCFPIVCLVLLISSTALANNYYLDPSSKTGIENGTLDNPWTTMNFVNSSVFLPGDTVFIKNGQTYPGNWYLSRSGTVGHPIVYTGYGEGAMPVLIYSIGNNIAIHIANASYVVIDGFKITDSTLASDTGHNTLSNINQGILLENSRNCTIKNCDISIVGTGIGLNPGSDSTIVTNNHIYNLRMIVNTPKLVNPNDDYGAIGVNVQSSYNRITYNKIEDAWAVSYDYIYDGGVIEFFGKTNNNSVMYNSASFCNGFLETGSSGSDTSSNNVIAYNKVTNCGNAGYFHAQGPVFGTYIHNVQFYNNVFVQTSTLGYSFDPVFFGSTGTPAAGMLIAKNNIFWSTVGTNFSDGTLNSSNFLHTNNMINLRSGLPDTTLSRADSTVIVSPWTTISGDPSIWNYALPAGSAAINYGMPVGLTTDFAGKPILGNPDAGIFEYISAADTALKATVTATPISCNGGLSTVTLAATGGTPPYKNTGILTLAAGDYNFDVEDAVTGDTSFAFISIKQPAAMTDSITAGTITTAGGATTISIIASGGTSPFTFSLNGSDFQTADTFTNVLAGTYAVIAKDSNGCLNTNNITINDPVEVVPPTALTATVTATPISCNGGLSTVTLAATGGTPPYKNTGTLTLAAGDYNFDVEDAVSGDTSFAFISIKQPAAMTDSISAGTITTAGGVTTITTFASGGTSPFTFSLNGSDFQTADTFTNVSAGDYVVIAKDSNGCFNSNNITINDPVADLVATVTSTPISTNGGLSTVTLSATGGTPPYRNTGTFKLAAGDYNFDVEDAIARDTSFVFIRIVQPVKGSVSVGTTITIAKGATKMCSTSPSISNIPGAAFQSENKFANRLADPFSSVIKDAIRNSSTQNFIISQPGAVKSIDKGNFDLIVYPNPSNNYFTVSINNYSGNQPIGITVYNIQGSLIYKSVGSIPDKQFTFGSNYSSGTYLLKVNIGGVTQTFKLVKF